MQRILLFLIFSFFLACETATDAPQPTKPLASPPVSIELDLAQANRLARLPLDCITTPLPYKAGHTIAKAEDLDMPQNHHPAFYGCFDWHSAVHGHWSLVYLLKAFPELESAAEAREKLSHNLTRENIEKELAYFSMNRYTKSFERTYGWAWLLKLQEELYTWDDPDAKKWYDNLKPLADYISKAYIDYLPKLVYPIRVGEHTNTAFGLSFAYDYARTAGDDALAMMIKESAIRFYQNDQGCPISWEPSGYDFLSPCLQEMDIMRKVLPAENFATWLEQFLPDLAQQTLVLEPGKVLDRYDGKLVHLDGLNFSRAWCLYPLANNVNAKAVADEHLEYSLTKITDGDYAGQHWLASFALYAFKEGRNSDGLGRKKENQPTSRMNKYFGPSTLIAAAFIGPGTLTTCTMVGVQTGYTLLWAMLFSIFATVILQEMSARLGFVTREGLGEAINQQFSKGIARYLVFFLVIGAILVGNAAYEAGNISGGVLGLHLIAGEYSMWPLVLGGISFLLLFFGKYKLLERVLIGLVIVMSICFLLTAFLVKPDLSLIFRGFIPTGFNHHFLLIMGLIGTTVVPYNLFLHASTISKKWDQSASLQEVRTENRVAIILGGLISMLIIITAAASASHVAAVSSAKDLAVQLEPLFGSAAKWLMGIGLLAAGLSSTLTAPMAAAYAAAGLFGWTKLDIRGTPYPIDENMKKEIEQRFRDKIETHPYFRLTWMLILLIGVIVSLAGFKPVLIIKFAQITNALLLPLIAGYLLYIVNSKGLMGEAVNSRWTNVLAGIVVGITILLSVKTLMILM